MIERVTFTGADDTIEPNDLISLSRKYPWVEWGILFPSSADSGILFPSSKWVSELKQLVKKEEENKPLNVPYRNPRKTTWYTDANYRNEINLSMHLCEPMVSEFIIEGLPFEQIMKKHNIPNIFQRVQINTHGLQYKWNESFVKELKIYSDKEFILQVDGANDFIFYIPSDNVAVFQDFSSGAGVFQNSWIDFGDRKYGYSGGLNINTLPQAIEVWDKRDKTINWIDMESGVRTNGRFDLYKVMEVIKYIEPYVSNSLVKV